MSIPLLDLKAQYLSIKEEIDKAVLGVLDSCQFILGPAVKEMEAKTAAYCGTKHAVAVANGTDALVLALRACGVGPGDDVITTPFTFFASAEAIANIGAKPVFVDIDPLTLNMDIDQLENVITPATKAIIAVHIFGQMVDMDRIMALAAKYDIKIIEDAAQAIGAEYQGKKAGSFGTCGTFSFFPTKNLGGYGDGGMVVTSDDTVAEKVKLLRFHGSSTKYHHDDIGYNSRLDEMQAAILNVKFNYLDEWNQARRQKASVYDELLKPLAEQGNLILPGKDPRALQIYHLYIIRVKNRDHVIAALKEKGIASGIYYPRPLHLQNAFAYLGYKAGDFPEAEKACQEAMAIPCYPELTPEQQQEIADTVISVHETSRRKNVLE